MKTELTDRIRAHRLRQPRAELERKAAKAKERANLWTQEEMDLADADAAELAKAFDAGRKALEPRALSRLDGGAK